MEKYKNRFGRIWINVGSSHSLLEDFVNIDNHVFIPILGIFPVIKPLIPKKYHEIIETYRSVSSKAMLIRHDCRKPLPFSRGSVDHVLSSHFLEHVYPDEMINMLSNFYYVLKSEGTVHIVLPSLWQMVQDYISKKSKGDAKAADDFIEVTILSKQSKGTFKYRLLEFIGFSGLQHRWMYDRESMEAKLQKAGFQILTDNKTPSAHWRLGCDELHIVAKKP